MAIKVIAQRRVLKIGKNPGVKKFVMRSQRTPALRMRCMMSERTTKKESIQLL